MMKSYSNGDEMREALETSLQVGEIVLYKGVIHTVIDAGDIQGKRIASNQQLKDMDDIEA